MSSKRAVRRKSCSGKVRYDDIELAWKAVRASGARDNSGWILPYKCRFCGGYHIGHAPKRVKKVFRAKGLR